MLKTPKLISTIKIHIVVSDEYPDLFKIQQILNKIPSELNNLIKSPCCNNDNARYDCYINYINYKDPKNVKSKFKELYFKNKNFQNNIITKSIEIKPFTDDSFKFFRQ